MPPNQTTMPPHPPSIELTTPTTALPSTTPHLMPFHIAHTGPAPLATYFRPRSVPPATPSAPSLKARFIAAFRGRAIQGLTVALPPGFSGIVLRGGNARGTDASAKQAKKATGRETRSSRKIEDDDIVMCDEDADLEDTKALKPVAKFASFTLWNADVEVDEESDEYLRFLSEYQRISTEIHRIP